VKINSRTAGQLSGSLGLVILLSAALASGATAGEKSASTGVSQDWKPTTLSEKTLGKINQSVESYHRCLNDETTKHVNDPEDSRKLTDLILSVCDPKLGPIKPAFQSEKFRMSFPNVTFRENGRKRRSRSYAL